MIHVEIPYMDGAVLSYRYLKAHEEKIMEMTHRALRNNHNTTTTTIVTTTINNNNNNNSFTLDGYIFDDNLSTMFNAVSTDRTPAKIPTFDDVSMTKAVVFGAMFVISFVGNVATLIQMYRMRRRKSTINTLIVNLALADLLVTFFCIAGEAAWAATVQWYGGDLVCKSVKYMQVFALYLSTYITVAISLDRCIAILDPMRRNGATLRVRTMILLAWGFSALFSIPQAVIFNVRRGPFEEEFYQCVTFGSYAGEWQRQLYSIASLLLMFVIPLVTIGTAYGLIFCTISRKSKEYTDSSLIRKTPELTRGPVRSNLLRKAKKKSLRMSIVIVLAFIICWTPYYVIFISVTFFKWEEIEPKTMLWFFFIGMTNTMLNPMIYGAFQLCKVHRPSNSSRLFRETAMKRTTNDEHAVDAVANRKLFLVKHCSWRKGGGSPDSSLKRRKNRGHPELNCSNDTPANSSSQTNQRRESRRDSNMELISNSRCQRCGHDLCRTRYHRFCKYGNYHYLNTKNQEHLKVPDRASCCFFNSY
ncbi:gonadotropin-releasing hormone receptor-like isoform X2 [Gigantopelta aegis]|uniref:gonadotropin-releasing hormone receptor-like isoform X2 n=1 Tax=Gigantopelta aegis TaxID=1735272 RepID=UPI001B8880DA|nr:gonadotropin-releasing hormone receptor-like isoform X2 [Gigantopelta aegis]